MRWTARLQGLALAIAMGAAWPLAARGADSEEQRLRAAALDRLLERQHELLALHEPIRLAAAELCGNALAPVLGAFVLSKEELPESLQDTGAERLGLEDGAVRVADVLPGYPGERGGLRRGDRILAAAGHRITNGFRVESMPSGSLDEHLSLTVERAGEPIELQVPVELGCLSPGRVVPMDAANAFMTDAGVLFVTSGMMRLYPSHDELAVVIGHEIAHAILGHHASRPIYEMDADYLGAYIAARAGADVSVAPDLWRKWALDAPFTLDDRVVGSHPGTPERALALRATVEEIQGRIARGEPLLPKARP